MTRTHDLLITNQLHYRLCYTSDLYIIILFLEFVKGFLRKNIISFCDFSFDPLRRKIQVIRSGD